MDMLNTYTPKLPMRFLILGFCMVVLTAMCATTVANGYPDGWSTHSFVGYILRWDLEWFWSLPVIAIIFMWWSIPQFKGVAVLPKRSVVMAGTVAFLSAVAYAIHWKSGLQVATESTTNLWLTLNLLSLGTLLALGIWARRNKSWHATAGFNFVLFLWFSCWAFPWLGETP